MRSYLRIAGSLLISFLMASGHVLAEDKIVSGKVTGSGVRDGIAGVTVVVVGTGQSTTTDSDGNYKIAVPENAKRSFSIKEFAAQEVVVGDQTEIDVILGM